MTNLGDHDFDRIQIISSDRKIDTRIDHVSPTVTLIGTAHPGTLESASSWKIMREIKTGSMKICQWANNNPDARFRWTDRLTLFPFVNTLSTLFDGVNDYAEIVDTASLSISPNLTVSAWVKSSITSDLTLLSHWDDAGSQRAWRIAGTAGDNKMRVLISDDGTLGAANHKDYESSVAVFDGLWHHIAFVFAAGTLSLYVDGTLDGAPTLNVDGPIATIHDSTADILMGARHTGGVVSGFYSGNLDEISVWNAALTGTQIAEIYNSGTETDLAQHSQVANLVSWWRMGDDDAVPTLFDGTGSNDATMMNMDEADFVEDTP